MAWITCSGLVSKQVRENPESPTGEQREQHPGGGNQGAGAGTPLRKLHPGGPVQQEVGARQRRTRCGKAGETPWLGSLCAPPGHAGLPLAGLAGSQLTRSAEVPPTYREQEVREGEGSSSGGGRLPLSLLCSTLTPSSLSPWSHWAVVCVYKSVFWNRLWNATAWDNGLIHRGRLRSWRKSQNRPCNFVGHLLQGDSWSYLQLALLFHLLAWFTYVDCLNSQH